MGAEAPCTLSVGSKSAVGKALLESEELVFRSREKGGLRVTIPLAAARSVNAQGGTLTLGWEGKTYAFELGDVAAKWLDKIKNPKSRAEKLGVKAGQRVALVGGEDTAFSAELAARGAEIAKTDLDHIFYWTASRSDVTRAKLLGLEKKIKRDGAIWVLRPKGSPDLSEKDVYQAARDAGLVDVKVVAFSATLTAEKMVIPVSRR